MIILERLNVVRQVATEEQAAKLEKQGFTRTGGSAEGAANVTVSEDTLAKMGEAMYERLAKNLQEAAAKAAPAGEKGKAAKDNKKEGQGGGTGEPGSGDGAK